MAPATPKRRTTDKGTGEKEIMPRPKKSMNPAISSDAPVAPGTPVSEKSSTPFISEPWDDERAAIYDQYAGETSDNEAPTETTEEAAPEVAPVETEAVEQTSEPADEATAEYAEKAVETPVPATDKVVQDEFYLAKYRTKEAAEAGIQEKDRFIQQVIGENAQLRAHLQQAAEAFKRMQAGGQQPVTPQPDAPPELSPEELEALMYSDFGKFQEHQKRREAWLVEQASKRAEERFTSMFTSEQKKQREQQMETKLQGHFAKAHKDLATDNETQEHVVAEAQLLVRNLAIKKDTGQLTPDDIVMWNSWRNDPTKLVDAAAESFRRRMGVFRAQGADEARQTRERLPENPVIPAGRVAAKPKPVPADNNKPMSEKEYLALREGAIDRALAPAFLQQQGNPLGA